MRTMTLVAMLAACAPVQSTVESPDDVDEDTEPDTDTDTGATLPLISCAGDELPELPPYPAGAPELYPLKGPAAEARWYPEGLPDDPLDPTSATFDPLSVLPAELRSWEPSWPEVPEDPGDQSGAMVRQGRWGDGPWTDEEVVRFNQEGEVVARWTYSNQLAFIEPSADGWAMRSLFFRDDWRAMSQAASRTSGPVQYVISDDYPLDGTFDGEFRVQGWELSVQHDPSWNLFTTHWRFSDDYPEVTGNWYRWADGNDEFDYDAQPVRIGARGFVSDGQIARATVPVLATDHGRTRIEYPSHDLATLTRVCTANGERSDRLVIWFDPRSTQPLAIRSELFDEAGGSFSRDDRDGDEIYEMLTTVTWDPDERIRTTVVESEDTTTTTTEHLDEHGTVVTLLRAGDGSIYEQRLVPVE